MSEQVQVEPNQEPQVNVDELMKLVKEQGAALDLQKKEIAGLNQKISKDKAEIEAAQEAARQEAESKKTVEERMADLERAMAEKDVKLEKEKVLSNNRMVAVKMLEEKGLPSDLIAKVDITSSESIAKDVDFFSQYTSKVDLAAKDKLRKESAFTPTGGGDPKNRIDELSAQLKNETRPAYRIALKRQIDELRR